MSTWNQLIHVRDKAKRMLSKEPDNDSLKGIISKTELYLEQINTAAGNRVKPEAENYLASLADFITTKE